MSTGGTRLLIDAGLSRREISRRLAAIGESVDDLDAVLITHEHCDHVAGLLALARKANRPLPVFLTAGTAQCIDWGETQPVLEIFGAGRSFTIGDIDVTSFTIPHDAADPVGFTVSAGGVKIALATDLGYVTESLRVHLRETDLVVLESNHDLEMLRVGPYPWSVQPRAVGSTCRGGEKLSVGQGRPRRRHRHLRRRTGSPGCRQQQRRRTGAKSTDRVPGTRLIRRPPV